ncbi:MAG: damage-control phosphatase ARMT1 family protein [Christensenellales bacterium]
MNVYLDCLPCMLRQVLEASRMATESLALQDDIIKEAVSVLGGYRMYQSSPEVARVLHRIVKNHTGISDPYKDIKRKHIDMALGLYPRLRQFLWDKQDQLFWGLKLAAIGNVIDSAIGTKVDIKRSIEYELNRDFAICDINHLESRLKHAETLLIIGDNAGETVFDRLLIETLKKIDIIYAVRSAPVLSDTTLGDALASGLGECCTVISTGCDVPGVILEEYSDEFLNVFYGADIVISKGQGNYETLFECGREIYFLLKAKCQVLSGLLGVPVGDFVFKHKNKEDSGTIDAC